jgi:hypothetical protein
VTMHMLIKGLRKYKINIWKSMYKYIPTFS